MYYKVWECKPVSLQEVDTYMSLDIYNHWSHLPNESLLFGKVI